jgi:hypothetical protein
VIENRSAKEQQQQQKKKEKFERARQMENPARGMPVVVERRCFRRKHSSEVNGVKSLIFFQRLMDFDIASSSDPN